MNNSRYFTANGDRYEIRSERRRVFHGEKPPVMFYGTKNGIYVRGTSGDSPKECFELLVSLLNVDEKSIVWEEIYS